MIIDVLGIGAEALGEVVTVVSDVEEEREVEEESKLPRLEPQLEIVEIQKEKSSEDLPPSVVQKILDEL